MGIVLDEYEWAESMIGSHSLGKKPIETLSRVAKYYYASGYNKKDVREKLDTFLVQCDPSVSLPKWSDALDKAARRSDKYPPIKVDGVDISDKELKRIETLDGVQVRRLAFTLLCAAKYWDAVSDKNDHWVNSQDREIMNMANIKTSVRRQSMMFAELKSVGMIRFSRRVDNLNVQVAFIEDGDTALHIHDFRNLGYQYMMCCGEAYFECENCGLTVKAQEHAKGRKQKYCPSCAVEVRTRQNVESVMRHRNALRTAAG